MQVQDELKETNIEHITAVLTGNGRKEFRILRAFDEKYNGTEKILFFPVRSQPYRGNGLQALRAVKTYQNIYGVTKYLFIVDKEAIEKDASIEVRSILTSEGVTVLDIRHLHIEDEEALLVISSIGSHEVVINIAINGREKKVEENIANLIELEYDMQVSPNETKRTLHSLGIKLEIFLRRANKKNISLAFPSLNVALMHIEEDV